jgi:hypothetical protein
MESKYRNNIWKHLTLWSIKEISLCMESSLLYVNDIYYIYYIKIWIHNHYNNYII